MCVDAIALLFPLLMGADVFDGIRRLLDGL